MIEGPERYLGEFAEAGADLLTVHVETCPHLHRTLQQIKDVGCRAGVSLNPATPVAHLEPVLMDVDLVLVLAVDPGFGGQSYIPSSTGRITRLRHILDSCCRSGVELEVDGGVKPHNAAEIVEAGATVLVAGSAVFGGGASIAQNIVALRLGIRRASDTHSAMGRS
jgi:ribulose-phosphate 3-epimerase